MVSICISAYELFTSICMCTYAHLYVGVKSTIDVDVCVFNHILLHNLRIELRT